MTKKKNITLADVLSDIDGNTYQAARVKKIKKNDSFVLRTILMGNFSSTVNFGMPEGEPPFSPNKKRFFPSKENIQGLGTAASEKVPTADREFAFIRVLESVSEEDAKVIVSMKDKDLESMFPNITREVFEKAYPNLADSNYSQTR